MSLLYSDILLQDDTSRLGALSMEAGILTVTKSETTQSRYTYVVGNLMIPDSKNLLA